MGELADVVRSPDHPGGESPNLFRPMLEVSSIPPDTITTKLFNQNIPESERDRILFTNLKKHPKFRHSLPSINAARAFKYGSRSFGRKQWYSEDFDIIRGLKNMAERRTFRFGLKANVDFLIQLDIETLKTCLLETSFNPNPPPTPTSSMSDGSFLDTMRHMDFARFQNFCTIFKRIQANLGFTQSLSEYFATDDMLEPALLVVSEAIRRNLNLEESLRGGSVAAHALLYRHRASPRDHDFMSGRRSFREQAPQNSFHPPPTNFSQPRTRVPTSPPFPIGTCWRFQTTNTCNMNNCRYDHACCHCHSKTHGKESCPDFKLSNQYLKSSN